MEQQQQDDILVSKKAFLIVFIVLILIGLGGALFAKMNESTNISASPSPSTDNLLFNDDPNNPRNQQQAQAQQQKLQNPGEQGVMGQQQQQNPQAQQQRQIKQYPKFPGELAKSELANIKAVIQTTKGIIEFEIFPDSPKAASNFIFLTKDKFYDGLTFHRVEPGFVIQGGDPLGNGTGGPGYKFEDEPVTKKYTKGIVAMANSGPDTNGSQFFIMLEDNLDLPPNYTIFGEVIKGIEVVQKISKGDVMKQVTIENLE